MALVSICLMFSLSSCDWLTVRVDDSKTCLHSAIIKKTYSDVKNDLCHLTKIIVDCSFLFQNQEVTRTVWGLSEISFTVFPVTNNHFIFTVGHLKPGLSTVPDWIFL